MQDKNKGRKKRYRKSGYNSVFMNLMHFNIFNPVLSNLYRGIIKDQVVESWNCKRCSHTELKETAHNKTGCKLLVCLIQIV